MSFAELFQRLGNLFRWWVVYEVFGHPEPPAAQEVWWCPECRAAGAADEDGCCTTCGSDCEIRPGDIRAFVHDTDKGRGDFDDWHDPIEAEVEAELKAKYLPVLRKLIPTGKAKKGKKAKDQYHGRVSILCPFCGYHETHDLSRGGL